MSTPIGKALGEGNCGSGDRPWGGSLRVCSLSRQSSFRRRPHSHQTCEATDRNAIQGRFGQASEQTITKPFPVDRSGGHRRAALVDELVQGKFTFLSGESWNPGPGVGFMPKAGAGPRKRLGGSSSQQRP